MAHFSDTCICIFNISILILDDIIIIIIIFHSVLHNTKKFWILVGFQQRCWLHVLISFFDLQFLQSLRECPQYSDSNWYDCHVHILKFPQLSNNVKIFMEFFMLWVEQPTKSKIQVVYLQVPIFLRGLEDPFESQSPKVFYLSVQSKCSLLHSSQWTIFRKHSCIHSELHLLIMWFHVSPLFPHSLHIPIFKYLFFYEWLFFTAYQHLNIKPENIFKL